MAKHILVVVGSPRKGGNSDLLADAFTRGALAVGHDVARFDAATDRVDGCTACDGCWSGGKACIVDDGFDRLAPMLEKADALVLCSPLYWYSFSSQLKSAVDKLYAYMRPNCPQKLKMKEAALLMCAEDTEEAAFTGPIGTYESILSYLEWTDRGRVLVTGVGPKGAIAKTDALAKAEALGRQM